MIEEEVRRSRHFASSEAHGRGGDKLEDALFERHSVAHLDASYRPGSGVCEVCGRRGCPYDSSVKFSEYAINAHDEYARSSHQ